MYLDDPELTKLDFSGCLMPTADEEPRIAEKLVTALKCNTHLLELVLDDSNLQGGRQAELLAASVAGNKTLRVLSVPCNGLRPVDLGAIFVALAGNEAIEHFRCGNQFCDQANWHTYQALAEALKQNRTLRKLGMELLDAHWRDQINRALVRNTEGARKRRLRDQINRALVRNTEA